LRVRAAKDGRERSHQSRTTVDEGARGAGPPAIRRVKPENGAGGSRLRK